jgi:uncharacterized protein
MKANKRALWACGVLLVISLVWSIPSEAAQEAAGPGSKAAPKRLIFFTYTPGSTDYTHSVAVADILNRFSGMNVALHPYPQSAAGLKGMHKGQADLGMMLFSEGYYNFHGIKSDLEVGVEEPCPELRMLMGTYVLWWAWVTRPDTKIKTVADLKGHKVVYRLPGRPKSDALGSESLRAVGLDPAKDVKHIKYDNQVAMINALKSRHADAIVVSLGGAALQEAKATVGIEVLPWTREIYNSFSPTLKTVVMAKEVPGGWVRELDKPTQLAFGWAKMIGTRSDLDEQAAYMIVKTVMENGSEFLKMSPDFREYGVKDYAIPAEFPIPFHPGAIRYFKEKGLWTSAHDALQQKAFRPLK